MKAHMFEEGDKIYLVSPITPFKPEGTDIEQFAFAENVKGFESNENLLWLKGNYVEADKPNANGHQWTEGELAIKSLTPMYCPVTVMHDPRTAVGLIADTRLLTPEADKVPRARIETALAIWAHRFPEIAAETMHNYEQGELMQSMECMSPSYDCAECGRTFLKLPDGAEQASWCEHLAEKSNAGRILRGVTFTGTGLIFGSRGARGAYSEAHLETAVKQEIVAAHQEQHQTSKTPSKPKRRNVMDITDEKYQELLARPTKEDHASVVQDRDAKADELVAANKKVEETEVAQKKAEKERDDIKAEKDAAEETARKTTMAGDRLDKLGKDFTARLGETTTATLKEQAAELEDDKWEARLTELEALTEVKRDAGSEDPADEGASSTTTTVTPEETASARIAPGKSGGAAPSSAARSSVIGGLAKKPTPAKS